MYLLNCIFFIFILGHNGCSEPILAAQQYSCGYWIWSSFSGHTKQTFIWDNIQQVHCFILVRPKSPSALFFILVLKEKFKKWVLFRGDFFCEVGGIRPQIVKNLSGTYEKFHCKRGRIWSAVSEILRKRHTKTSCYFY